MPSATRFRMGSRLVRGIALLPGILVVLTTIGLSSVPVDASAAESWGYDLKYDLMSPFCPGRTLASCTSPQAAELAQWILVQEAAGATREEVLEILVERFGEEILGAPPAKGIMLWAYVFPPLAFVLGGAAAFLVLRRIVARRSSPAESAVAPAPRAAVQRVVREASPQSAEDDDELARIVDQELGRRA